MHVQFSRADVAWFVARERALGSLEHEDAGIDRREVRAHDGATVDVASRVALKLVVGEIDGRIRSSREHGTGLVTSVVLERVLLQIHVDYVGVARVLRIAVHHDRELEVAVQRESE